jgi:hypothetical protein
MSYELPSPVQYSSISNPVNPLIFPISALFRNIFLSTQTLFHNMQDAAEKRAIIKTTVITVFE